MKTLIFSIFIIMPSLISQAQINPTNPKQLNLTDKELANKYLKKSKSQKTIGGLLLVSGITVAGIGVLVNLHRTFGEDKEEAYGYYYLGAGLCTVSVPFLISAGQNKKAAQLILRKEKISVAGTKGNASGIYSIGFGLKI